MEIFNKYKSVIASNQYLKSFVLSIIMLAASLFINYFAGSYATERASNPVTDLILNNIPVFDIDGIFIYGAVAMVAFIAFVTLPEPRQIPFVAKNIALFVFIRSFFISFTHLGLIPDQIAPPAHNILGWFTFGGDLFFSGHTGLPFLMALIFWNNNKILRYIFIALSIFFAVVVLLGHFHYSIDVFSAFFITYSIYKIAETIFKKDHRMFLSGVSMPTTS